MLMALLFVVATQSDPLEQELAEIVRRFESPEATHRETASNGLQALCRR